HPAHRSWCPVCGRSHGQNYNYCVCYFAPPEVDGYDKKHQVQQHKRQSEYAFLPKPKPQFIKLLDRNCRRKRKVTKGINHQEKDQSMDNEGVAAWLIKPTSEKRCCHQHCSWRNKAFYRRINGIKDFLHLTLLG